MVAIKQEVDGTSPFHTDSPQPVTLGIVSGATFQALSNRNPLREPADIAARFDLNPASPLVEAVLHHKRIVMALGQALTSGEVRFNPVVYSFNGNKQPANPTCVVVTDGHGEAVATLYELDPFKTFFKLCLPQTRGHSTGSGPMQTAINTLIGGTPVSIKSPLGIGRAA